MFISPGADQVILSPTDIRLASECEYALVRKLDVLLGRSEAAPSEPDRMLDRVASLGNEHEQRVLRELRAQHPGGVRQFGRPDHSLAGLQAAADATLAACADPEVQVIYQACVFDGSFVGFADFLVRDEQGAWMVVDTKLARHEQVAALIQIAAYAQWLIDQGVTVSSHARLVLGSGEASDHELRELLPVYRLARRHTRQLLADHMARTERATWELPLNCCGSCPECKEQMESLHDVLLVAGVHASQRKRLLEAEVHTIEQLAERTEPVPGIRAEHLAAMRQQAQLQLKSTDDEVSFALTGESVALLPPPDPGDIFFDFEGDPLWSQPGDPQWGLEYLFGVVEVDGETPVYRAWWAHDREQEKQALIDFVAYLLERRERFPQMHVYHYAAYERTALLRLAARHEVTEDQIDDFLRAGLLVDLYTVVKASVRVGQPSYSIKKLEPLYLDSARDQEGVTAGADSIVEYHEYSQAVLAGASEQAAAQLERIRAYNEDDCVSTFALREWLLALSTPGEQGHLAAVANQLEVGVASERKPDSKREALDAAEAAIRAAIADIPPAKRTDAERTIALAAAAINYYSREDKPYWWAHFARLREPTEAWTGDYFVISELTEVEPWGPPPSGKGGFVRTLRVTGQSSGAAPQGGDWKTVYPISAFPQEDGQGSEHLHVDAGSCVIEEVEPGGPGEFTLLITERAKKGFGTPLLDPVGLMPVGQVPSAPLAAAIVQAVSRIDTQSRTFPPHPGLDVLRRRVPRLSTLSALPEVGEEADGYIRAIGEAVADLDHSTLSVQGPPGTGKTYVASHVITELVRRGWRIGVTAQSHATVGNVLDAVVRAGTPPERVGKAKSPEDAPWTTLAKPNDLAKFLAENADGCVVGGTAWDFVNRDRVGEQELDLIVIDEAGQFSLAHTLAVSEATTRLLLLGDPAQLPQVVQGVHPDGIDQSALSWIAGEGVNTIPESHGYFLARSWRMHPAVTQRVSHLSYGGRLRSQESVTAARSLEGVEPGVHSVLVEHRANARASVEEAEEVARRIEDLLGTPWQESAESEPRPLEQSDVIVLTPYNEQLSLIQGTLAERGLGEVPVGTVDLFQGKEAAIAIISLASSQADAGRGLGFVLDRNRLNVAISRAQWAAFVVASPALSTTVPSTIRHLKALGGYLSLIEEA